MSGNVPHLPKSDRFTQDALAQNLDFLKEVKSHHSTLVCNTGYRHTQRENLSRII